MQADPFKQIRNFLGVVTCNLLCIKMIIDYFWDISTPFGSQKVLRIFVLFPIFKKRNFVEIPKSERWERAQKNKSKHALNIWERAGVQN